MSSKERILLFGLSLVFPATLFWINLNKPAYSSKLPLLDNQSNLQPIPSCGIVINEFDPGVPDAIELYNANGSETDLNGWRLRLENTIEYTFTNFTLQPDTYVVIEEYGNSSDNSTTWIYTEYNLNLSRDYGAITLIDINGSTIDFVRWGVSEQPPPPDDPWLGDNPPAVPPNFTLGRDSSSYDDNNGSDWCLEIPTLGTQNGVCNPVFLPLVIH